MRGPQISNPLRPFGTHIDGDHQLFPSTKTLGARRCSPCASHASLDRIKNDTSAQREPTPDVKSKHVIWERNSYHGSYIPQLPSIPILCNCLTSQLQATVTIFLHSSSPP